MYCKYFASFTSIYDFGFTIYDYTQSRFGLLMTIKLSCNFKKS